MNGFDPENYVRTSRWVKGLEDQLRTSPPEKKQEVFQRITKELNETLPGKSVEWQLPVVGVTRDTRIGLSVQVGSPTDSFLLFKRHVINGTSPSLIPGEGMSLETAHMVRQGDTISLPGTVEAAGFQPTEEEIAKGGGGVSNFDNWRLVVVLRVGSVFVKKVPELGGK